MRIIVNGEAQRVRARHQQVEQILFQAGLSLNSEDIVTPARDSHLQEDQPIEITLARPVVISFGENGHRHPEQIFTTEHIPIEIYKTLGIELQTADIVIVDGVAWPHDKPLPVRLSDREPRSVGLQMRVDALRPEPVHMRLNQAIPVRILDGEQEIADITTLQTVGDVLVARNIPLYLGDLISHELSQPLQADMTITIERATPVSIQVDGTLIKTRSRLETVAQVLAHEGIALIGQDYTVPSETSLIQPDTAIQVVRVTEALEIDQTTTDFETTWVPDPDLALDSQEVRQEGFEGITKTRTRVRYENGAEVDRTEEETWLAQSARDKVIAYGTKVTVRTQETPDGSIEYWRKIRMLATSYSAATSGKSKDHPAYGITKSGLVAGYGIVAVDPGVVELLSDVYVPGYGQAIAGDTGGAIIGKHIDLGFDEDAPPLWYKWVDVYLLTPVPNRNDIRYVLPQWPQERFVQ